MKQLLCDACGIVCKPNSEFSMFIFTKFGLANGQLVPQVGQEDYCSDCTDKVKRLIEGIKNENTTFKQ